MPSIPAKPSAQFRTFKITLLSLVIALSGPALGEGSIPNKPFKKYSCSEIQDLIDALYSKNAEQKLQVKHLRYTFKENNKIIAKAEAKEAALKAKISKTTDAATKRGLKKDQRKATNEIRKMKRLNRTVWADLGESEDFHKDFPKRKADLLALKKSCKK